MVLPGSNFVKPFSQCGEIGHFTQLLATQSCAMGSLRPSCMSADMEMWAKSLFDYLFLLQKFLHGLHPKLSHAPSSLAALVLVWCHTPPHDQEQPLSGKKYLFPCRTGDMGHAILWGKRNKGIQFLVSVRCYKNWAYVLFLAAALWGNWWVRFVCSYIENLWATALTGEERPAFAR